MNPRRVVQVAAILAADVFEKLQFGRVRSAGEVLSIYPPLPSQFHNPGYDTGYSGRVQRIVNNNFGASSRVRLYYIIIISSHRSI